MDFQSIVVEYGNGVWNSNDEMDIGKEAIQTLVGELDNLSYGKAENRKAGMVRDIIESYRQKQAESPKEFWKWVNGIEPAPDWFQQDYAVLMERIASEEFVDNADLQIMIGNYIRDLNSGKKVVIVAHSQGNLFANSAIRYLKSKPEYQKYENSIAIVSVASPANRIEGNNQYYVTNTKDLVIKGVKTAHDLGLIPYPPLTANATYDTKWDFVNHGFISTYIEGLSDRIKATTNTAIAQLSAPPKEFECENPDDVDIIVGTNPAVSITSSSAVLKGNVVSGKNIDVYFKFSPGSSVSICSVTDNLDGIGPYNTGDPASMTRTGLLPNTTYSYRVCGKGTNDRVSDGGKRSFTSADIPVQVRTLNASSITQTTARLLGRVDSTPNSKYYFRVCGKNRHGQLSDGGVKNFTTDDVAISTLSPANVEVSSIRMRGKVTSGDNVEVWFAQTSYFTTPSCSNSSHRKSVFGRYDFNQLFYYTVSGLDGFTLYKYRACGRNAAGAIRSGAVYTVRTDELTCNSSFNYSGGSKGLSVVYRIPSTIDRLFVEFEAYNIPDSMTITDYSTGSTLLRTPGYVSGRNIGYISNPPARIRARVDANSNSNTKWWLKVTCQTLYGIGLEDSSSSDVNAQITTPSDEPSPPQVFLLRGNDY